MEKYLTLLSFGPEGWGLALLQGAWPAWDVWLVLAAWIVLLAAALSLAVARSRDQLVDWL